MKTNARIQRKATPAPTAPALAPSRGFGPAPEGVHPAVLRPSTGGTPLPPPVQAKMEGALGHDFSNVRVHQGDEAPSIGALAFARGSHVHFAPGQYRPHTADGQRVLAHELAHVVQQREGRVPSPGGAVPINDDARLEGEADWMGARTAQGGAARSAAPPVAVNAGTGPIQRMHLTVNGRDFDVDEELLLSKVFEATLARQNEFEEEDTKESKKLATQPLPKGDRGLSTFPLEFNVGSQTVQSVDDVLRARILGQNNPASKHMVHFEIPGRRAAAIKQTGNVVEDWKEDITMTPGAGGFHASKGGDYNALTTALNGMVTAYQKQIEAERKENPLPAYKLTAGAEAHHRTGRLLLSLMKDVAVSKREDIFKRLPGASLTAKDEIFKSAIEIIGTTSVAEGHRNILMLPLSLMAFHQIKHGVKPSTLFQKESGKFPGAATGTEEKLKAIHRYYARGRDQEKLDEKDRKIFNEGVHDKVKQQIRSLFQERNSEVITKYLEKRAREKYGQPKTLAIKNDKIYDVLVDLVKRKFLRIKPTVSESDDTPAFFESEDEKVDAPKPYSAMDPENEGGAPENEDQDKIGDESPPTHESGMRDENQINHEVRTTYEVGNVAEIANLGELGELGELGSLGDMGVSDVANLARLHQLKELTQLERLGELGEIDKLKGLGRLGRLGHLGRLENLGNLKNLMKPKGHAKRPSIELLDTVANDAGVMPQSAGTKKRETG